MRSWLVSWGRFSSYAHFFVNKYVHLILWHETICWMMMEKDSSTSCVWVFANINSPCAISWPQARRVPGWRRNSAVDRPRQFFIPGLDLCHAPRNEYITYGYIWQHWTSKLFEIAKYIRTICFAQALHPRQPKHCIKFKNSPASVHAEIYDMLVKDR